MSQTPQKSGPCLPRLVTASATITKRPEGKDYPRTAQRNRVANVQSCCAGTATEGGGVPGAGGGRRAEQVPSSQPPKPSFAKCFPEPPPCCLKKSSRKPCGPGQQYGGQPPPDSGQQQAPPPRGSPASSIQNNVTPMSRGTVPGACVCINESEKTRPEKLDNKIRTALMNKSILKPTSRVTAKARQVTKAPTESIETPAGIEPVLQKAIFEKRVERDEKGEALIKSLVVAKLNDQEEMDYVELGIQQLEPKFAKMDGKEVIGITSTVSITPSYATVSKEYIRALTQEIEEIGMTPEEVAQLIEEEKEDVENTLKIIPPDLLLSPGRFEMKQRLQQLRLNSESVALLEQSIIMPEITADEAQTEPDPEAMATVMHTVEVGISPTVTPDQVFNSLFREPPNESYIFLSSVTPGPLQDVVVPTQISKDIHKEAVTNDMSKLTEKFNNINPSEIPHVDIFSETMGREQKFPEKTKSKGLKFEAIKDENSQWVGANLEHLVDVVGAEPAELLEPINMEELQKGGEGEGEDEDEGEGEGEDEGEGEGEGKGKGKGEGEGESDLTTELANGVQYFVDANSVQYMNRVQLRGTQLPSYFPGYMLAVPEFPELVRVAKDPDEVFGTAWKSVQTKFFKEEAMFTTIEI